MIVLSDPCEHCGDRHAGACPRIKAIQYYANGRIKRVEYFPPVPSYHLGGLHWFDKPIDPYEITCGSTCSLAATSGFLVVQ